MPDNLMEADVNNFVKSKAELDKYLEDAKTEDPKAKAYTDVATLAGKRAADFKKFIDDKKKNVGHLDRKDKGYLELRKALTELVAKAKTAVNQIKAEKQKAATDALKDVHVAALAKGKENLDKLLNLCKKEGPDTKEYKELLKAVADCGDIAGKIATCKSNIGKVPKTFKDFVNTNANLMKLVPKAKQAYSDIMKAKAKPWTVTCNSKVESAAKSKSCVALGRVMNDIKKYGIYADGLRYIKGNVYDVHCSTSGDDRWVGVADEENRTFEFKAHYDHGKKGKVFKAGEAVSGY